MADADVVFAIVMVCLTPVSVLCILFNLVVVASCRRHSIDVVTCTLLLGRLGHACAVVILMAMHTLENWTWTRAMCAVFVWLWISCWVLDLFVNLLFLAYNSSHLGHDKTRTRYHTCLLLFACWALAVLAGALTFIIRSMFHSYQDERQVCTLGLSVSDSPILIGTMLVIIIGSLLIIVLTISVSAESRAIALKHKLIEARAERMRTPKIQNGDISAAERDAIELNGVGLQDAYGQVDLATSADDRQDGSNVNNSNNNNNGRAAHRGRVYTWAYVDKHMRDVRHIHAAATATTLLLNMAPQLVLYSIDIISGTLYAYTHHILVAAGMVHCIVLPVTFCTAGIRYKETSKHLVKGIFGRSTRTRKKCSDAKQNVVFHISDVTTDDTSDATTVEAPQSDSSRYTRGQLQVLSMRGEPSLAPSSVNDEKLGGSEQPARLPSSQRANGAVVLATEATISRDHVPGLGSANPAYEDDTTPGYARPKSDGSIDYGYDYGSDDDWESWDSDSETWSNLYDYSDGDEAFDGSAAGGSPGKLSPAAFGQGRRTSKASQTGSRGARRKLSSQTSWPPGGMSPGARERRRSHDRRRKKRSKKKRRHSSKGLVSGLEATVNLGIASTMLSRDQKTRDQPEYWDRGDQEYTAEAHLEGVADGSRYTQSANIPPPPPLPSMDSLLRTRKAAVQESSNIEESDGEDRCQSEFASQLAAAATRLKRVSRTAPEGSRQVTEGKVIRNPSSANISRKTSRISIGRLGNVQSMSRNPSQTKVEVQRSESRMKHSIGRRQSGSTSRARTSAPPGGQIDRLNVTSEPSRPVSAPELDPELANMTLAKIMKNPFLKDMLRRSLESLDTIGQDQPKVNDPGHDATPNFSRRTNFPSAATSSSSDQSENSNVNFQKKVLYEIPNIDSDHRYRPRKPIRRGKYAFKAAAQTVIIQEFLKRATGKPLPAPKPNLGRKESRTSWNSDVINV